MSVFSKNAIMRGCVEHYCLACETPLRNEEDAVQHISKPIHRKNLEATSYLDKHRADRVRKVKKGYFCEFCSLFMRTAAKVGPHVAEATHRENKVTRRLRREGNGVLAFDSVFIGENAWHGIIGDTCAVCDAEYDNAQIHKTDSWHALNLVLIEIEIGPDDNIYRKIDESTFQCLTCNSVCALNTMVAHFEDAQHKKLYQQCCDVAKAKFNKINDIPEKVKSDKDKKSPETEVAKVAKQENAQKPESEKVAEKDLSKDDKCKKSENESPKKNSRKSSKKEFAKEENKKPVEVEKKEDKKAEEKAEVSDTEKKDENPGKGTKVPAAIKNMKEHVNGNSHKSKIAKTTVKTTVNIPTMTPSHVFIDNVMIFRNTSVLKDIVINEKYPLNILSFLMIMKNGGKFRCQACEVNLAVSEIDSHKNTRKHVRAVNDTLVVASEETEFIREIRPNLFHCGFCNQLEATWATMGAHLKSTAHREAKTAASWRMVEYARMIAQHKANNSMESVPLIRLLMEQMFGDD